MKLEGQRPSDRYFRDCRKLADMVIEAGLAGLAKIKADNIMFRYKQD